MSRSPSYLRLQVSAVYAALDVLETEVEPRQLREAANMITRLDADPILAVALEEKARVGVRLRVMLSRALIGDLADIDRHEE